MIIVYLAYAFPEKVPHIKAFHHLEILAYLSLSQCKLKTQQFVESIDHATKALTKALEVDPPCVPDHKSAILALYRRAQALGYRVEYAQARSDLETASALLGKLEAAGNGGDTMTGMKDFGTRFSKKLQRLSEKLQQMQAAHARRTKMLSRKMFQTSSSQRQAQTTSDSSDGTGPQRMSDGDLDEYVRRFVEASRTV